MKFKVDKQDDYLDKFNNLSNANERRVFIAASSNPNMPSSKSLPMGVGPFLSNKISSTKYTILTFLPLSFSQQLKSVINSFFIINGILQCIPSIRTNSPLASFIPVSWVILMGMIFELITDLRRWRSDKQVNNYQVERVFIDSTSKNIKTATVFSAQLEVGDIIVLQEGAQIPADCVVL